MPPLSSLRALFTLATAFKVPDKAGKLTRMDKDGEVRVLFIDVKKARFWSPVRRRLLVELPPEAGEDKTKVGLLKRSLYGTRDAPSNWEHAIKDVMECLYVSSRESPTLACMSMMNSHCAVMFTGMISPQWEATTSFNGSLRNSRRLGP